MNNVILIGRTTKSIELKKTTSGTSTVSFSIAVNRPFKNDNGEYESDFINCIVFGKLAETISTYVSKGDLIGVEGALRTRNYTDKDGNNRYATEVRLDNVEFLQPKKQEEKKEVEEVDPFGDLPFI